MPIISVQESAPDIDAGIYQGELTGYEEYPANQFGPGIKLIWTVVGKTDREGNPYEKWQIVSQTCTPRSRLYAVLTALGQQPPMGARLELDDLMQGVIGRRATLTIKHVDGPNGVSARITDVNSSGEQAAAPAAPRKPLAEKLADDPQNVCAVPGCGRPSDHASARGTFFCAQHNPEDM